MPRGKNSTDALRHMNVPCLMPGLMASELWCSDANGLLVAHPRLGWLELSPRTIAETAPDGFEVILVDRQRHAGCNIPLRLVSPALQRYRSTLLLVLGHPS